MHVLEEAVATDTDVDSAGHPPQLFGGIHAGMVFVILVVMYHLKLWCCREALHWHDRIDGLI